MIMIKVSVVKSIQIRYEYVNVSTGKVTGWNNTYRRAFAAANDWASNKRLEWDNKMFERTGLRPHYTESAEQQKRYYDKSLPIFKKLLE